ncbi:uncharacterized protein LOC121690079 [Alosa sapidissima]|uniref:uncharacterized protein LOC121690079 n=1 Tax=Alosa sapidissima TaxID=34773 RepID=UPI001C07FBE2|nr:uncharacterized protein LOC121690079 [Alosa sapidissima]
MDQQGSMFLGLNIRLALVYLALTGICVCCGQHQERSYVFKGFQQSGLQAVRRMGAPDSAEDPMELPPSGEWMAGSDWVRRESERPAPRSHTPGRPQLVRRSSSYSQSGVPSTQTAIRHPSRSLQGSPGSTDPGPVAVVHGSYRPVQSQFGYWSTNPDESRVSIMRHNADWQDSPSVVSSSAINVLGSSAHSRQASASVKQAHGLGAGGDATVSTSVAEQPFKEALSRGGAQYVKIKLHKRPNWIPHPLMVHHEGQGQSLSSVDGSSSYVQHGMVNSPIESRHVQAPQSNIRNVQSVSSRDGYGLDKPKTGELGDPAKRWYRPYKVIHASNSSAMGQPSDAGSSVPGGYQALKNADPQMVARPDGLFDQHRSAGDVRKTTRVKTSRHFTVPRSSVNVWLPSRSDALSLLKNSLDLVSNAGALGSSGSVQSTYNQYSKPIATAVSGKGQSTRTKFQQNEYDGKHHDPNIVTPQYSSSAKPGQNTNVRTSNEPQGFRQNRIEDSKSPVQTKPSQAGSGVSESGPRQTQISPVRHQPTKYYFLSQPGPDTAKGHLSGGVSGATRVPQQTKNSDSALESSSTILGQRHKGTKPSHALTGPYSRVDVGAIQSSRQKEKSREGAALSAIITGNADFGPKFGRLSSVSSPRRGSAPSQGIGKNSRIQTRLGYFDIPSMPLPDYFGADGKTSGHSGSRLTPDVLKTLSRLDHNMARLAQTKSSTSSFVVGTRMNLPASSQKGKPWRKFKPVSLADIGGSVAIRPRKKTRSALESDDDDAALPHPGDVSTLQSSHFPAEQSDDTKRVDDQKPTLLKTHRQRNRDTSDGQHPEQSQKAQQSSSHDTMNIHRRFTPRSGGQVKGRSWDAENQSMVTSANSERNGGLGSSPSTEGSIAPPVAHEKHGVEFDKAVQSDPRTAHLIQSAKSTSSFVAGRHVP